MNHTPEVHRKGVSLSVRLHQVIMVGSVGRSGGVGDDVALDSVKDGMDGGNCLVTQD